MFRLYFSLKENVMKMVYECMHCGPDGSYARVIGYCADEALAGRIVSGRGNAGKEDGKIKMVPVWETLADLPAELRARVEKQPVRTLDTVAHQVDLIAGLLEHASPAVRAKVLSKFSK